ncbi:MAG: hypothetical protein R3C26_14690 [Calditrichia bacterium]
MNPRIGVQYNFTGTECFRQLFPPPLALRLKNYYDAAEASTPIAWGVVVPQFEQNADGSFDFDNPFIEPEKLNDVERVRAIWALAPKVISKFRTYGLP